MKRALGLLSSATAFSVLIAAPAFAQSGLPGTDQTPAAPLPAKQPSAGQNPSKAASPASATQDVAAPETGRVEDIVVTAQRRSENLQKVPIAITAITSESLARNSIHDVTDLSSVVPGLNINSTIGFVTSQLRGVGTTLISVGFENPVAIYVDGVYYASPSASVVNFSNIERVEVLKGPQGTLFGRNATGGLIQIVSKDPSHTLGGAVNLSYGNYQTVAGDAYITGGLTDDIAMDLSIQGSHQGKGWGHNIFTGDDNYKNDHDVSGRSKIVYSAGGTRIALSVDYADYHNSLNSEVLLPGTYSPYTGGPVSYPGRYDSNTNIPHTAQGWNGGGSLTVEHDIGFARVKSITAYRKSFFRGIVDIDETPVQIYDFNLTQRDRQFSQEVQLLSRGNGRFTWVLGGFYFNAVGKWDPFAIRLGPVLTGAPFAIRASSFDRIGTKSLAGYAQGTFAITDNTKITLGGRYTNEDRSREAYQVNTAAENFMLPVGPGVFVPITAGSPVGPNDVFPKATLTYKRFTYRAAIDHEFSETVLGYISANRGFKSGGYNPTIYSGSLLQFSSYKPEQLDAYEVGVKSTLADRRVRLNVAAFYYNYQNLQLPFIANSTVLTINGAKARIYGVDGDVELRVSQAFRLTGGFQFLHDEYVSFPDAPLGTPLGGVPLTTGSAKGHHLNFVASTTLNLGADYTIEDLANGSLNAGINAAYNGGFFANPDNLHHQDRFVLLNGTVKWTSKSGLSLGLYGKNLGNVRYVASLQENQDGGVPTEWAPPRTYGVTAGFKF